MPQRSERLPAVFMPASVLMMPVLLALLFLLLIAERDGVVAEPLVHSKSEGCNRQLFGTPHATATRQLS